MCSETLICTHIALTIFPVDIIVRCRWMSLEQNGYFYSKSKDDEVFWPAQTFLRRVDVTTNRAGYVEIAADERNELKTIMKARKLVQRGKVEL